MSGAAMEISPSSSMHVKVAVISGESMWTINGWKPCLLPVSEYTWMYGYVDKDG